ncbi:unnamed protein product [Blepharisma stoltei]|uniref:Uncharacterized protein n=1 Tax=Blepharisma stoltei TaxID=1481888 RepID=A0AAU9K010_9CILI|nr:unnamed protein product [Blepharisma stoltei]
MSLFIGNISRNVTAKDLHAIFDKFGKCAVDVKGNFAFIDFEQARAADQAKGAMHGKEIMGNVINIEWSKKGPKNKLPQASNTSKNAAKADIECYVCGELGHMAKECKHQEKNENGHKLEIDRAGILENLRKEKSRTRARLKSPDRYSKMMLMNFNILRPL